MNRVKNMKENYKHLIVSVDPAIRGTGIVVSTAGGDLLFAATIKDKNADVAWEKRILSIACRFNFFLEEFTKYGDSFSFLIEDAFHFRNTKSTIINVKLVSVLTFIAQCYSEDVKVLTPKNWTARIPSSKFPETLDEHQRTAYGMTLECLKEKRIAEQDRAMCLN